MAVKELVQLNNQKRLLLSNENEAYYEDILLYLRLQFSLSEQETEEVLMDVLNHILDAQANGQAAQTVFGEDPRDIIDQMIDELPKASKGNHTLFFIQIALILGTVTAIIKGGLQCILTYFTRVNDEIYLFNTLITIVGIGLFTAGNIIFILRTLKRSLFKKKNNFIEASKIGLVAGASMTVLLLVTNKVIPKLGTPIVISWWVYIIIGIILFIIYVLLKSNEER